MKSRSNNCWIRFWRARPFGPASNARIYCAMLCSIRCTATTQHCGNGLSVTRFLAESRPTIRTRIRLYACAPPTCGSVWHSSIKPLIPEPRSGILNCSPALTVCISSTYPGLSLPQTRSWPWSLRLTPGIAPAQARTALRAVWFRPHAGWMLAAGLLAVLGISLLVPLRYIWPTPQDRFWSPITSSKQPVLIYVGSNVAYIFTSDFLSRYRAAHQLANTGPEIVLVLPPKSSVHAEDLLAMKDTFVTNADTSAIVQLTTQLRDWNKPFMLRSGGDLSVGDLRNRPSILVGAFNNSWTMELTHDLPFSFREGTRIQDRDHPGRSWSVPSDAHEGNTDDYALISRVLSSKTGGPCIMVAGIGQYGTQAAAEFVTDSRRMRELLKAAPRGWENKNMQFVLHVKAVDFQPMGVEVVAASYW